MIATIVLVLGGVLPVRAAVSQSDVTKEGVAPPPNAALPLNLPLQGEDGLAGKHASVWALVDYACETLCGPVVSIVSDTPARSGLRPDADFRLIVVGLDPKDTAADAARIKEAQAGSQRSP